MLILAGVSISAINKSGIISKTEQARLAHMESECNENINLDISEIRINKDNLNKIFDLKLLYEQLPIVDAEHITLSPYNDGDKELTGVYNYDDGKYSYNFTIDENLNVSGEIAKTGLFEISIPDSSVTTKSATVNINTKKLQNIKRYTYIFNPGNTTYLKRYDNKTETSLTTDSLKSGTTYKVSVLAYDENENVYKSNEIKITTKSMPTDEEITQGAISFSDVTWANNKASIVISTGTDYTIQYQVVAQGGKLTDTWTNGTSTKNDTTGKYEVTVNNLSHGNIVYARLSDGAGNYSNYTPASIIDKNAPTIASFDVESTTTTSIKVKATASDAESGIASYTFYIKETSADSYPTNSAQSDVKYIFYA